MSTISVLIIFLTFSGGVILAHFLDPPIIPLLCGIGFLLVVSVFKFREYGLLIAILLLAAVWHELRVDLYTRNFLQGKRLHILATVKSIPEHTTSGYIVTLKLITPFKGAKIRASLPRNLHPEYGDTLKGDIYLTYVEPQNPDEFDYYTFLKNEGFSGAGKIISNITIKKYNKVSFIRFVGKLREKLLHEIDAYTKGDINAFLKGILLGERRCLRKEAIEPFRKTGIMHILAISGLHTGIIATFIMLVLAAMRVPLLIRYLVTVFTLMVYVTIVGLRIPVIRSSIMLSLALLTIIMERKVHYGNILALAAIAVLIMNPGALFQISFQLSFGITMLIFVCHNLVAPHINMRSRIRRYLLYPVMVFTPIQVMLLPYTAYHFHYLPVAAPLMNPIVVPLTGFLLICGWLWLLLSFLPIKLFSTLFGAASFAIAKFILTITQFVYRLRIHIEVSAFPLLYVAVFILLFVLGITVFMRRLAPKYAVIGLLAILNLFIWQKVLTKKELHAICMKLANGNAFLITHPANILVNAGMWYPHYDEGKKVSSILKYYHAFPLEYIVGYGGIENIGGLPYVVENFPCSLFVGFVEPTRSWQFLKRRLTTLDVTYKLFDKDTTIKLRELKVTKRRNRLQLCYRGIELEHVNGHLYFYRYHIYPYKEAIFITRVGREVYIYPYSWLIRTLRGRFLYWIGYLGI
ncbi:hypothetical protein CGW93_04115 [candidate division bacterium WOR-3 4484_18]|uniref:Uncharacterized protein n=1 Tax=candidate division WOR-3 bacterium 4484_18 TaxID=2020626 RepID=A0A257LTG5_UNCW3|nr:MAG: hypothetical protein CGW93_04115 [candidate division bacterium WOR-3 4484_18]